MRRVLITGMSGTGKSTLIEALAERGYKAVDADHPQYSHVVDVSPDEVTGIGGGKDWVWREDRMQALLASEDAEALFVAGCSPNQGKFYPQFDHVVLLTAPTTLLIQRLAKRDNNPFGKDAAEVARVLHMRETVEPALRRSASTEIDTSMALEEVVETVLRLAVPGGRP